MENGRDELPRIVILPSVYMSVFVLDDLVEPLVSSSAPYIDDDGDPVEAAVTLRPFGGTSVMLQMSTDEAEALGRRLLKVSQAARDGRYTDD